MSLSVAFRADASVTIGTGHVLRCLTLAQALATRGHRCRFITRDLPGHLGPRISAEGFALTLLPAPSARSSSPCGLSSRAAPREESPQGLDERPGPPSTKSPVHAGWAQVPAAQDAAETRAAAAGADWLILDHYAFDAAWEAAALPPGTRLMVIDDLADRPHLAHLLLDQNLGRRSADYDPHLPPGAERLIGPRHALLRPAFADARPAALAARAARGHSLARVLVTMGGVDPPDATGAALAALAAHLGLQVTVVMGAHAPALPTIRARAAALPSPATVLVDTPDMAALMAEADLAIGAAGGTAWERCALGLPSLIAVLADNQAPAAAALHAAGAALSLGRPEDPAFAARLAQALMRATNPATLAALSRAAAAVTDGRGAARVAAALDQPLTLRPATIHDAEVIWHWRRSLPPAHFRAGPSPPLADHLTWFARALTDPARRLYAAGDPALAHLRLDRAPDGSAAVSILLAPQARGRGLAPRLLSLLADAARADDIPRLTAEVHATNAASLALFAAAGYTQTDPCEGFRTFALDP